MVTLKSIISYFLNEFIGLTYEYLLFFNFHKEALIYQFMKLQKEVISTHKKILDFF